MRALTFLFGAFIAVRVVHEHRAMVAVDELRKVVGLLLAWSDATIWRWKRNAWRTT